MKTLTVLTLLSLVIFGFQGSVLAYEGGTKFVAMVNRPAMEQTEFSPIFLVHESNLMGTKPVVQFLHQTPQPTLSTGRLREERLGPSLGTKGVVRFRKKGWI